MRGTISGLSNPHPLMDLLPGLYADDDLAVRLTSVFDDDPDQGPSGDAVVASYEDLLPALGLA